MVTAQSIYNQKGASYLTRGTKLSRQYINSLRKIGISKVTITSLDPDFPLAPPEDIIKEETRVTAIHQVFDTYCRLQQNDQLDILSRQVPCFTILASWMYPSRFSTRPRLYLMMSLP